MYCEQIKYQTINLLPLSEACLLQLLFKRNQLTNASLSAAYATRYTNTHQHFTPVASEVMQPVSVSNISA